LPFVALAALTVPGCGSGEVRLPEPRPIVIFSGERIRVEPDRMKEIHAWVTDAVRTINEDPSFFLDWSYVPEPSYPWETMVNPPGDTVRVAFERAAPDARTSYWIYAFLYQMKEMDRLVDWFPEAAFMEGFELERFIVARTADSWLLGRATFDTHPYQLLDELIYAQEAGMLDAFLLYTRGDEFPEARDRYMTENPGGFETFEEWYRETFGGEPPGGS
jgi:hypothetical protein